MGVFSKKLPAVSDGLSRRAFWTKSRPGLSVHCLLLVCALALSLDCSRDTVAGGVDDTGNFLTGTVATIDGDPVQGCALRLKRIVLTAAGDSVIAERSAVSGPDGVFSFVNVPGGRYSLLADHAPQNLRGITPHVTIGADSLHDIGRCIVQRPRSLFGRIAGDAASANSSTLVCIPGVGSARPDEEGFYCLDSVPVGFLDLAFIRPAAVNYLPLSIGAGERDTVFVRQCAFAASLSQADRAYSFHACAVPNAFAIVPSRFAPDAQPQWYAGRDFTGVRYFRTDGDTSFHEIDETGEYALLVDDFDDGDNHSALAAYLHQSVWYAYADAGDGGSSVVKPEGILSDFTRALTGIDAWRGTSVACQFVLAAGAPSPFANIAVSLDPDSGGWADLSAMTGCSFYLKGRGTISVRFVSKRVESYPVDKSAHFGRILTLPADWQLQRIDLADLRPPAGSQQEADGLTWEAVRDSVRAIIFGTWGAVAGDSVALQLDEVYLHGLTAQDLIRP